MFGTVLEAPPTRGETGEKVGVDVAVSRLSAAAVALGGMPGAGWGRRDLVAAMEAVAGVKAAVAAAEVRLAAAVDALGDAGADGVSSWKTVSGCSEREARRAKKRAQVLGEMPAVTDALSEGRVNVETADVLVDAVGRAGTEAVEGELLGLVAGADADSARRVAEGWLTKRETAADVEARLARQRRRRRGWRHRDSGSGMWRFGFELDSVTGTAVAQVLDREMDRLWRHDGGRDGTPDAVRSVEQRRADAFTRLMGVDSPVETDRDLPAEAGSRGRLELVAVADVGVLSGESREGRCEIVDAGPIPPTLLAELIDRYDARICGAIFAGPGRPLWLGRSRRLADAAQRIALAVRDGGCVVCGAPFAHTHAHHVEPYAAGGRTDIDQLASLCAHCHTQVHTGIIRLRRRTDGTWYPVRVHPGGEPGRRPNVPGRLKAVTSPRPPAGSSRGRRKTQRPARSQERARVPARPP
ncbi:MAG: HNH endonuclease [Actinomyces sp.]|nr:MAG: HNH endonuclease [Actinomyces sp.]